MENFQFNTPEELQQMQRELSKSCKYADKFNYDFVEFKPEFYDENWKKERNSFYSSVENQKKSLEYFYDRYVRDDKGQKIEICDWDYFIYRLLVNSFVNETENACLYIDGPGGTCINVPINGDPDYTSRLLRTIYPHGHKEREQSIYFKNAFHSMNEDGSGNMPSTMMEKSPHTVCIVAGAYAYVAWLMNEGINTRLEIEEVLAIPNNEIRGFLLDSPNVDIHKILTLVDTYHDEPSDSTYLLYKGELDMGDEKLPIAKIRCSCATKKERSFLLGCDVKQTSAKEAIASLFPPIPEEKHKYIKGIYRQGEKFFVTYTLDEKDPVFIKAGTTPRKRINGDIYFGKMLQET